jgi:hypothetical protein
LRTRYSFYVKLALANDQPLLAFDNTDTLNQPSPIVVRRWDGSQWQAYGGAVTKMDTIGATFSMALDTANNLVIVYEQFNSSTSINSVMVKRWNNGAWNQIGSALNVRNDGTTKPPLIAIGSDNLPVVFWSEITDFSSGTYTLYTKQWNGSFWSSLGPPLTTEADEYSADLSLLNNNAPVVTWTQRYHPTPTSYIDKTVFVSRWNSTTRNWQLVGSNPVSNIGGYPGSVYTPSIDFANNSLVIAWRRVGAVYNGQVYTGGLFVKRTVL